MHGAAGLALHRVVDDASGDAVDQQDAHEAALRVRVGALRHHRQQVGVQVLEGGEGELMLLRPTRSKEFF